jgi:hypothetical protein
MDNQADRTFFLLPTLTGDPIIVIKNDLRIFFIDNRSFAPEMNAAVSEGAAPRRLKE